MTMKVNWIKHAKTEEEKEKIRQALNQASTAFEILRKIISNKKQTIVFNLMPDYTNLDWAYKTADNLGYLRALEEIENLITQQDIVDNV